MLVLSRRQDTWIEIGDDIRIKVVEIRPNLVRLGIEAPKDVRILRDDAIVKHKRGLAGADAELEHHKADQSRPDDQVLQQKMEDERDEQ